MYIETIDQKAKVIAHAGPINDIHYYLGGNFFATGSSDKKVILWDQTHLTKLRNFPVSSEVKTVFMYPNGKTLCASCSDDSQYEWDINSGSIIRKVTASFDLVRGFRHFWGKSSRMVSNENGVTFLYAYNPQEDNFTFNKVRKICKLQKGIFGIHSVSFSNDGTKLLTGSFNNITMWDAIRGVEIWSRTSSDPIYEMFMEEPSFSKEFLLPLVAFFNNEKKAGFTSCSLSGNGELIICGTADSHVLFLDADDGDVVDDEGYAHESIITKVSFSPTNDMAVSGDLNGNLVSWRIISGKQYLGE